MQTRGDGVKKSDIFVDIINGSPLTAAVERRVIEDVAAAATGRKLRPRRFKGVL